MGVSVINLLVTTGLGLRACGQHTVNFSHLVGGSVSVKQLKRIVMNIPWGKPGPCSKAALLLFFFPGCSSLVSPSPPFPD